MSALSPPLHAVRPSMWRSYAGLFVPMVLTNVLQAVAGTVDGVFVGHLLGVGAMAAVSAFIPVFLVALAVVIGLSIGATVLAGQAWGAGRREEAQAVAGSTLALVVVLAGAVAAVGGCFAPALMRALGTPADVLQGAVTYARWMLLGAPLLFTLWFLTSMSRALGDAITPLWTLLIAAGLSLVLTPAFICGWGGLPMLGVASAAASTLVGSAAALAWMLWHWRRAGHPLAPDAAMRAQVRLRGPLLARVLWIGAPTGVQMLAMALAEMVLLGLVNRHGSSATAAYGAVSQVMSWLQFPALSLGITATIVASHAIGAGRAASLGLITRTGLAFNLVVTGTLAAAVHLLAPVLLGLFIADDAVLALAVGLLRLVAWTMVMRGAAMVLGGVMRASGTVWMPTAWSVLSIACIEVPAARWLDARVGLQGIWWAYGLTFGAMLALQAAWYLGVWRRRAVRRLI